MDKVIIPPRMRVDLERIAEGRQHDPEINQAMARELLKITRANNPLPQRSE